MKKKNIMYIFNDMGFGGAGQSLIDTLVGIKERVNPVIIIRDNAPVENKFIELGVKYYRIQFSLDYIKIGSADERMRTCDFKQSYDAALQLIPIIQKENIHLIHINSSTSYFAAVAALMANVPYIWHIRELMDEHYGCEFINESLKMNLYKRADKLIAISDYVKSQYDKKYGLDMIRVYNGLDTSRFKMKRTGQFNSNFIVAAKITPAKRQWDVIQAVELLVESGYCYVKVIIVGSEAGSYVWALKKYVKWKKLEDNIYILPFCSDLSTLRSQVSYAISSSQNEALGRVVIESMLAQNIVIGAESGGTVEIIGTNEERGFLYELGNSKSLADTMKKVMNMEPETKEILIQKAQQYAEDTFGLKKYCTEMLKIYDDVIQSYQPNKYNDFLYALKQYYDSIQSHVNSGETLNSYKKDAALVPVVLKWLEIKQMGHSLTEYFQQRNIYKIAIYGMGALGCRLYDELENSDVAIEYLIDRNPNGMDKILKFVDLHKMRLEVDAVIVTVISEENQIVSEITKLGYENVVGLSEILNSFERNFMMV